MENYRVSNIVLIVTSVFYKSNQFQLQQIAAIAIYIHAWAIDPITLRN